MSEKDTCLAKVQACRPKLATWLEKNPAVILRWLHDAGAFRQDTYFKLVETRPESNQVISVLELMLKNEDTCRTLVNVLQQVKENYSPELQIWLRDTFPIIYKQPSDSIDIERIEKKTSWEKFKGALSRVKKYKVEKAGKTESARRN